MWRNSDTGRGHKFCLRSVTPTTSPYEILMCIRITSGPCKTQILIHYVIWRFCISNKPLNDINVGFPTTQRCKVRDYTSLKGRDRALIFSIVSGTGNLLANTRWRQHKIFFPQKQSRDSPYAGFRSEVSLTYTPLLFKNTLIFLRQNYISGFIFYVISA